MLNKTILMIAGSRRPSVLSSFPVVESVTSTAFASEATAHDISMPGIVNSGDLLLVLFCSEPPTLTKEINVGTGFSVLVHESGGASSRPETMLAAKVADGTEGGTTVNFPTDTANPGSAQCIRVSNWFGALAGVEATGGFVDAAVSLPFPLLSPSWPSDKALWLALTGTGDDGGLVTVFPSGYSGGTNSPSGGPANQNMNVSSCWRHFAAASETPGNCQLDLMETGVTITVGIRPAA